MIGILYIAPVVVLGCACLIALRQAERRSEHLRAVLESTDDGILVVSAAGRVVTYNRRFVDMWRIPEPVLESKDDATLLRHVAGQLRDPDAFLGKVRELYQDLESKTDDVLEFEDGRVYERHSEPQRIRGKAIGRVWGFRDVTECRRIQARMEQARNAAENASRVKTEFLHNMSHEIRTPMNGVIGMVEIALESDLDPDQRECLGVAKMSAENLLAILNDIGDFSKIESGKLEFDPAPFDVRECVERTAKSLAQPAHRKGLEIICDIAASVPDNVLGDAARLRQVLLNLAGNAVKFTEQGEVVIAVDAQGCEARPGSIELRFAIRDSGIGIRAEDQRRIFEPFQQADASLTRIYGGTGLGLTISQRLIELMGGHIWVESKAGRGSTFWFTLPVGTGEFTQPQPGSGRNCFDGLPVLLVESNATSRRVLGDCLSRWGARVQTAEDNVDALGIVKSAAYAAGVVLADAQMPGTEALAFAVWSATAPRTTLILMLTAGRNAREIKCCRDYRAVSLTKPVAEAELRDAIQRVLGDRPDSAAAPALPAAGEAACRRLRILLAEDNAVNRKVTLRLLQKEGHSVTVVRDGHEALDAAGEERFQLVFMDIEMPEMDGFGAAAAIRARERDAGGHMPIVGMTAHAMSGDRDRCLAAGMDDCINKPLRRADLAEIVRRHIDTAENPAPCAPPAERT